MVVQSLQRPRGDGASYRYNSCADTGCARRWWIACHRATALGVQQNGTPLNVEQFQISSRPARKFRYLLSWIFVRPRRWLFLNMVYSSTLRLLPRHDEYFGWIWPNLHWWILYKTVFRFFKWLHWDAWRRFCKWGDRGLIRKTFLARAVQRIGQTTAGYAIGGGECFHCGSEDGCQVELANDETGTVFILGRAWSVGTQDGTDHRFCGTTICPKCGYESYYEDGSL